ncbi:MAG: hypothetical protein ABSD73_00035 [Candidatus Bathyarchaeia archaeon]|jgi:hypothetical protein
MVSKLQILIEKDVLRIREVFAKCRYVRFLRSFSHNLPFGTRDAYVKEKWQRTLTSLQAS